MGLGGRVARVDIVQVCGVLGVRLSERNGLVEARDEGLDVLREGERGGVGGPVVLKDPERGTIRVRRRGAAFGVDLGVRTAVEVDDREPGL